MADEASVPVKRKHDTQKSHHASQKGTIKLPVVQEFGSVNELEAAIDVRLNEAAYVTAGESEPPLIQFDKRLRQVCAQATSTQAAASTLPVVQYINKDPACQLVFQAWDLSNRSNNPQLSAACLDCFTSILRFASLDPFATKDSPILKQLLSATNTASTASSSFETSSKAPSKHQSSANHLDRALNPGRNDVTTSALKLFNTIVAYRNGAYARRLFHCLSLSPKTTSRLFKTRLKDQNRDPLQKPDIRTLLVGLVLGFLSASDPKLKSMVIEHRGLLSGMVKGLHEDSQIVINHVLTVLWRDLLDDRSVALETRRSTVDESLINELVKLYNVVSTDSASSDQATRTSAHRFLLVVSDWLAAQIDTTKASGAYNGAARALSTVLKSLKVTEDALQRDLALRILEQVPSLTGTFWSKFPSSLDPRLSSRWISAITFATQVVSLAPQQLVPSATTLDTTLAPPTLASLTDTCFPPSLAKAWFSKSLQHENSLVSFLSSILLVAGLQKACRILEDIQRVASLLEEDQAIDNKASQTGAGGVGRWTLLGLRLRDWLRASVVPDTQIIVSLMTASTSVSSKKDASLTTKDAAATKEASLTTPDKVFSLRTNVALRLLWLYHRAIPMSISTVKFDFNKLPQSLALREAEGVTADDQDDEGDHTDDGVEGVRAMSAAYALRLAAVHSDSMSMSKPAEYFKTTLLPLFELDRTRLTRSNRTLLRSNLARLLNTSILFGNFVNTDMDNDGARRGSIVHVWLRAMPDPSYSSARTNDDAVVLDFFQQAVHDTLTMPIKRSTASQTVPTDHAIPLLDTILESFVKRIIATDSQNETDLLVEFVESVWIGLIGYFGSKDVLKSCFELVQTRLADDGSSDAIQEVLTFVNECWAVVNGEPRGAAPLTSSSGRSRPPLSRNVFDSFQEDNDGLKETLQELPVELVALHIDDRVLSDRLVSDLVVACIQGRDLAAAIQVLVHRLTAGAFANPTHFSSALRLIEDAVRGPTSKVLRQILFDVNGLYKLVASGDDNTRRQIVDLLARILDSNNNWDINLAQLYCDIVTPLLDSSTTAGPIKSKEKKRKRQSDVGTNIEWAIPLLSFLPQQIALVLLDRLLTRLNPVDEFDEATLTSLNDAMSRARTLGDVTSLWVKHFSTLVKMVVASSKDSESASVGGNVLVSAAQSLMSVNFVGANDQSLRGLRRRNIAEPEWQSSAEEWTTSLLKHLESVTLPPLVNVLVALVYRSSQARSTFVDWIKSGKRLESALPLRSVLLALAKVGRAHGDSSVPTSAVTNLLQLSLSKAAELNVAASRTVIEVVVTAVQTSTESADAVNDIMHKHLESLSRDDFTAFHIALSDALIRVDQRNQDNAQGYANGCLEGLTRRFAEDEYLSESTLRLAQELARMAQSGLIKFKGHLLDTLVTAAIQFKLDLHDVVDMTMRLVEAHDWKDNEVTRHVNAVIAKANLGRIESTSIDSALLQKKIVEFVLVLAKASLASAASNRIVEKLLPLYRGTLAHLDQQMLDVFRSVELVAGESLALALRAWSPTSDAVGLSDPNSVASLTGLSPVALRRCCVCICSSSKMSSLPEADASTYDPAFLLPLVSSIVLNDDLKVHDWVAILEGGALSLPIAALASSREATRLIARATLGRAITKLESLPELKERDELLLVLSQARMCLYSPAGEPIPSIIALFLSEAMATIGRPASPRYPLFVRFLLQRPILDQKDVPMMYQMFYSTSDHPVSDRIWILKMVEMGLCRSQDWKVLRRRQVFELLASLFETANVSGAVTGYKTRAQNELVRQMVLRVLVKATSIAQAGRELLSRNGVLSWISAQSISNVTEASLMLKILANLALSTSERKGSEVASAFEALLVVCRTVKQLTVTDLVHVCLTVTNLCAKLSVIVSDETADSVSQIALDQAQNVLSIVHGSLPRIDQQDLTATQRDLVKAFYGAVMLYEYVLSQKTARTTTSQDHQLYTTAVDLMLAFGDSDASDLESRVVQLTSV
ncbi:hypothetical protein OIV83_006159 [Microbotryomycetes sp. JL201]|nr:hypothetical protein OIV83_006159 [Microbotryomycetes sp. JL201]